MRMCGYVSSLDSSSWAGIGYARIPVSKAALDKQNSLVFFWRWGGGWGYLCSSLGFNNSDDWGLS